jgi:nicotinate-nucleotide pyrophosphorylase (carboxylating)
MPDGDVLAEFALVAKQTCVLSGRAVAEEVLAAYDPEIKMQWAPWAQDAVNVDSLPATLATLRGRVASVLAAERVLLNFLQRLCGVATLTRAFVDAIAGTQAAIYDTRKTTPGWRLLEKYAVRCGGGKNHRQGLFDAVLIKDNHLAGVQIERLAGAVFEMLSNVANADKKPSFIEVEAASLAQMHELCKVVGIDVILLDNFDFAVGEAVQNRDGPGRAVKWSWKPGGVTLQTVRGIAESGMERISVGALTHSAPAIDICLERM